MQGPLSEGRFNDAIDSGVKLFVNALAEKFAFNPADLESSTVASASPEVAAPDSSEAVLISGSGSQKTRPRTVAEGPKPSPEATPPAETPKPTETPIAEPVASESPAAEPQLEYLIRRQQS